MVEEMNLNFRHLVRQGLKCQVEVALQSRVSKPIRIRERVPNAMKNLGESGLKIWKRSCAKVITNDERRAGYVGLY